MEKNKPQNVPIPGSTAEQTDKIYELYAEGYVWNEQKSMAAAGVILEKGTDFWFFGLQGEIMHNPDSVNIKL